MHGELRLHLGCGSTVVAGWENIDKSWGVPLARSPALKKALNRVGVLTSDQAGAVFPAGIVRADLRKGIPYPDGSAAFVYSSHMIEHMSRWQGARLLRECARVLRSDGVIRLATPDLRAWAQRYLDGDTTLGPTPADSFMEQLGMFYEREESSTQRLVRRIVTAPHQWLYDGDSLSQLLRECGFPEPRLCGVRESAVPDLDKLEVRGDSLFVEAVRP